MSKIAKWIYFNCSKCGKKKYLLNTEENKEKSLNFVCKKCLDLKKELPKAGNPDEVLDTLEEPKLVQDEDENEQFFAK